MTQPDTNAAPQPVPAAPATTANARQHYEVTRADLPLACPMPAMALWNSHPRVYLPIEANRTADGRGVADCPYCGAHFVLVD